MKIANINIQNLFHRDNEIDETIRSSNLKSWVEEFHLLMGRADRNENVLTRLRELAFLMGFSSTVSEPYLVMRRKGGQHFVKVHGLEHEKRATAKVGWNGWVAVRSSPIHEKALRHKLQLVAEMDADILVLQEVEDRKSLMEFNGLLQEKYKMAPYGFVDFIEGNDMGGRGMALLTKNGYSVISSSSNAHIPIGQDKKLFEMDCPLFEVLTPLGERVMIINAHFTNKIEEKDNHALRKEQAQFVSNMYRETITKGTEHVLICGTLNEPSFADSLSPLLRDTHLKDISKHDGFEAVLDRDGAADYYRLGAYRKGVNIKQFDYMLCSPVLFSKIGSCGMDRRGLWGEDRPNWPIFPSLRSMEQQASGHPMLWGTFDGL
jgi:endonuclease/exonuclease/phosphatase family metal-dependent hydrolase